MAWVKTTEEGIVADGKSAKDAGPGGTMTLEEAKASAKDRNERATAMGIKARYEVGE